MSSPSLFKLSRNLTFAAFGFFALGAVDSSAQDITPGSSVMEAKSKKPPAKSKPAAKTSPPPVVKAAPKPGKTTAPRAKTSQPPAKNAKPQPKAATESGVGRLELAIISGAQPVYTGAAKQAGAAGAVRVEVLVDEKGEVVSAEAKDGHELLRAPAEAAARASKFVPRQVGGKAVATRGYLIYCFGARCE